MDLQPEEAGVVWQTGVWNRMSAVYEREIDRRFVPVVDGVVRRARLAPGERVLDLGCGTGAVAERAARAVGPAGRVLGVDLSTEMLAVARQRAAQLGLAGLSYAEGRAERMPADDRSHDAVLSSLCLMFVIDRAAAAREIARVLKPGGRFVAAVWGAPEQCDIVRFQQIAGSFAPKPPVAGVGPGALADARPLVVQLADAGIDAVVESEVLGFNFDSFGSAWDTLAAVTTAQLPETRRREAMAAVREALYPRGDGPRHFRNLTQFIAGTRR